MGVLGFLRLGVAANAPYSFSIYRFIRLRSEDQTDDLLFDNR